MGNPKMKSRFICCKCLKENPIGDGIQRIQQREKGHIKDMTCITCNEITKNMEIRYCETFDEIFKKAKKIHLQEYSQNDTIIYQNIDIDNLENLTQESIYFKSLDNNNSLIQNGLALIEYKVPDRYISGFVYKNNCIEYKTTEELNEEFINAIYIPEIFKSRIKLSNYILKKVKWCKIRAYYEDDYEIYEISNDKLHRLGKTSGLNSHESNYLKGKNKDNSPIEVKYIQYITRTS